jgi:hypothetical protein
MLSIVASEGEEVARGKKKKRLHNEELHNRHDSQPIIRVFKPRKVIWAGHVACMVEMRNAYNIWLE